MKILLAFVLFFSSCAYYQFSKGVQNDILTANRRTEEYLTHLTFSGFLIQKLVSNRINNYELKIKLNEIDSFPTLVNRKRKLYFRFESDSILYIVVNQSLYNMSFVGDSIFKTQDSKFLFSKGINGKNLTLWLP